MGVAAWVLPTAGDTNPAFVQEPPAEYSGDRQNHAPVLSNHSGDDGWLSAQKSFSILSRMSRYRLDSAVTSSFPSSCSK